MKRQILCFALFLTFAFSAYGQVTGLPPFGSLDRIGAESRNNQDLNVLIAIPIMSSPGRAGSSLDFSLVYNSDMWSNGGFVWLPNPSANSWGWTTSFGTGQISWNYTTSQRVCNRNLGDVTYIYTWTYNNYQFTDNLGTVHKFNLSWQEVENDCLGTDTTTGTFTSYATDGSGLLAKISQFDPTLYGVTTRGGIYLTPGSITDRNGNIISSSNPQSGETDWTDSAGRLALKTITGSSSIQYKVVDPTGAYQTYTLNLQNLNVKTNFACSGVTEYTGTASVPSTLVLPNGQQYSFTYESYVQNSTTYYTGRLQRMTLPTGGYYEYDYTGAHDGANCADGSTVSMNRVVSDGTSSATWNYVRNTTALTTTITTPALADTPNAFDTVITFNTSGQETQRRICSTSPCGSGSLRIINTNWATNGTPSSTITFLEDNNTRREVDTTYDSNGLLDSVVEYDWGTGAHGSTNPIRTTSYTYQTSTNYTNLNILDLVTSVQVSSGTVLYRQDTTYDGVALLSSNCPAGALQHSDTGFPCTFNYRGNPTAVTTYLAPATQGNPITKNFTYDWFGNLTTAQVNCCQTKTWSYSSATQYSLPDSVMSGTSPGPTLTTSATYNTYTGQPLTVTDENLLVTNFSYDTLRRPTRVWQTIGSTNGASVSTSYDDVNFTTTTTATVDASKSVQQITAFDALGRAKLTTTEDAGNNIYAKIAAVYDLSGRPYQVSNPFTGGSGSYWTTTAFDLLGRPTKVTLPDNSFTQYSYALNTVTVTDPAGVQRKSQSDAAGRLTSVWEPDPTNGNSLTLQSTYLYNVLDELTQITQGVQTRSYVYDAIGRLLSATTPEAGRVCFGSVSGSTCNADGYDSFNNLQKRTDARGVLTSYGYDGLNRLNSISYNVGTSGVPATASVSLTYGTSTSQFNNGRLITMTDGVGSENYSYNNLGQLTQLQKVINGTSYTTGYAYNVSGELTEITYPSGRVVQQSVDPIGRLCEVAPSTTGCGTAAAPFATGFLYNTAGQTTGFKYGNNVYASFGFSPDRLQLNCLDYSTTNRNGACTHDGTTKFGLNYLYPATPSNNGLISGISDSVDSGRSATYTYDSLYRLVTAATAGSANYPAWGLQQTYDRYGNRSAQTAMPNTCVSIACPQPSVTISQTTNHLVGPPYAYDLNGNMTNDGFNTIVYNAENHAVSATNGGSAGAYVYDGNGLRVQKCVPNCSGSNPKTVYIFSGSKVIAEYDNGAAVGSPSREYIYSGATLLAKIDSSGTKYYHQDHLSNRYVTDSSDNKLAEMGTFPYGESWYNASNDKLIFTTYERDSESGNDYAQARYSVSGLARFSSPDLIAGSASDPQSFNRYSYVRNQPIMLSDPSGLIPSCTTLDNRSPDSFTSGPTWGGGPSDPSLSSEEEAPPSGCGGPPPCQYTLAGCGGGFGGPGGAAGLDGGFSGDDSGMAPTFGIGQSPGDSFSGLGMTLYTFTGSANFHWLDYDLEELLRFASQGEISVSEGLLLYINTLAPGDNPQGAGGSTVPTKEGAIQKARKALLDALLQDPDCINFLASKGADVLNVAKNIPITPGDLGYYAIAAQTFNAPVGLKAPTNPYVVVNNIGAFFNNYNATGYQASILLHELGHATGVLVPDGVMTDASQTGQLQEHNQLALQLNCGKTLAALGQH